MEKVDLKGQPLDLDITLGCGQAFRWQKRSDGIWMGVVRNKLLELTVEDGCLYWRTYPDGGYELIHDYLRLGDDVNGIYDYLSNRDSHILRLTQDFRGLRILRQDPTEALLTFVCSTASNIPRITAAVEGLSAEYGDLVCEKDNLCYRAFPRAVALAGFHSVPTHLYKALGFRERVIKNVASQVLERGEGWLMSLRGMHYAQAKAELVAIKGIGQKIADCVCLFSLDKDEAVPVDTHVRQIAHKLFLPELKAKSVTDQVYRSVATAFVEQYGDYAGWAQEFLFYEDLLRTRAIGLGKWTSS